MKADYSAQVEKSFPPFDLPVQEERPLLKEWPSLATLVLIATLIDFGGQPKGLQEHGPWETHR